MRLKELIAPSFWKTFKSKKPRQIDKGGRGSTKTSKNSLKVSYHCNNEQKCVAIELFGLCFQKISHYCSPPCTTALCDCFRAFRFCIAFLYTGLCSTTMIITTIAL